MKAAAVGANEEQRLRTLRRLNILDTDNEKIFDEITQIAAAICGTPVSLVTLIDKDRQWVKAALGLPGALVPARESSRDISFCAHVVYEEKFFEVEDAFLDERFSDNPFVTGAAQVRFYAGAPLTSSDGFAMGSLCVIDHVPRQLTSQQRDSLSALARHAMSLIEAKVAAATLLGERENLNALLENMIEGVAIVDANGVVLDLNQSAAELYRRSREVLLGKRLAQFVNRVVDANRLAIAEPNYPIALALRTGQAQRGVAGVERTDGSFAWISFTIVPLPGTLPNQSSLLCTLRDITAARNAELEVQRLSALKELVLDHTQVGVITCAPDGSVSLFNAAAEQITGYSAEEVLGRQTPAFFDDPDRESGALGPSMRAKQALTEWRFRHRSGRMFPASLVVVEMKDDAGSPCGFLGMFEDLTEKQQLAYSLEKQRLTLINNAKMASLGEMAGGMAHEVNNPLAIICACAEDLISRAQAGTLKLGDILPAVRKIDETAVRIAKIIRGLKTFSRSSERDPPMLVSVRQIVDETLGLCREHFRVNGVQISVDVPDKLLINCRPTQISQVLMNLLNNAFDATEGQEARWVTLSALAIGPDIQVAITDSGCTILPEVRERLMQPFFTTKEVGKGTGLGLSISKGIVESHGGRFFLREDSARTTFVFELPNYSGRGNF